MSHSTRGSKGPGFEYWSARPFNHCGGTISPNGGKHTKKRTHKAERQTHRGIVEKEIDWWRSGETEHL